MYRSFRADKEAEAASSHLFAEPHFDQRLIGHVALVSGDFDLVEQADRQAQRNRCFAWLQVPQPRRLRPAPVEMGRRIRAVPISPFLRLVGEGRDKLTRTFSYTDLSLRRSCRAPEITRIKAYFLSAQRGRYVQPPSIIGHAERMKPRFRKAVSIIFQDEQRLIEERLFRLRSANAMLIHALSFVPGVPVEPNNGAPIQH